MNNIELKSNETYVSESQLKNLSLNVKRESYYPVNTILDFTGEVQFIKKISSADRDFLVFVAKKNDKESRIPASMILRRPFDSDKAKALDKNDFMRSISTLDGNIGANLWTLLKGKKIKVTELVDIVERPYNESNERPIKYSIFEYFE